MFRKTAILVSILLLAAVAACGSHKSAANTAAVSSGTVSASASPGSCPTANTRHFAKTRFVLDAGLAAGAFKRYIYTPYRDGKFKSGANGRKVAIAKAAVAGAFVLDRLYRAKQNAQANPSLCKAMVAPVQKFIASVEGLISRAKGGSVNPADVASGNGLLQDLRSAATRAGAAFKDQNATVG